MKGSDVCFFCAAPATEYLSAVHKPGRDGIPFFPCIRTQVPAPGSRSIDGRGSVQACYLCYRLMHEQWLLYERQKMPLEGRQYFMKTYCDRATIENFPCTEEEPLSDRESTPVPIMTFELCAHCGMQAEVKGARSYPAAVMRHMAHSVPLKCGDEALADDGVVLWLCARCLLIRQVQAALKRAVKAAEQCDVESSIASPPQQQPKQPQSATTDVCYVCAKSKATGELRRVRVTPASQLNATGQHESPLPLLGEQARSSQAKPIDADGHVLACAECHQGLKSQELVLQQHKELLQRAHLFQQQLYTGGNFGGLLQQLGNMTGALGLPPFVHATPAPKVYPHLYKPTWSTSVVTKTDDSVLPLVTTTIVEKSVSSTIPNAEIAAHSTPQHEHKDRRLRAARKLIRSRLPLGVRCRAQRDDRRLAKALCLLDSNFWT